MCPPALPSPIGQGSLVQRELSPGGRLRDCPRLLDTSGMLSAACPTHPLRPLAQMLRPAPLARAVDGASLSSRRGRCPHRPVAWHPGRTVGAGLRPRPLLPGLREVSIESVGADPCVGPDTLPLGTRSRADTEVRPYAVRGGGGPMEIDAENSPCLSGKARKAPPLPGAACFCTSKGRKSPIFCAAKQGE